MNEKPTRRPADGVGPLAILVILAGCVLAALAVVGLIAGSMDGPAAERSGLPDWSSATVAVLGVGGVLCVALGAGLSLLARPR